MTTVFLHGQNGGGAGGQYITMASDTKIAYPQKIDLAGSWPAGTVSTSYTAIFGTPFVSDQYFEIKIPGSYLFTMCGVGGWTGTNQNGRGAYTACGLKIVRANGTTDHYFMNQSYSSSTLANISSTQDDINKMLASFSATAALTAVSASGINSTGSSTFYDDATSNKTYLVSTGNVLKGDKIYIWAQGVFSPSKQGQTPPSSPRCVSWPVLQAFGTKTQADYSNCNKLLSYK